MIYWAVIILYLSLDCDLHLLSKSKYQELYHAEEFIRYTCNVPWACYISWYKHKFGIWALDTEILVENTWSKDRQTNVTTNRCKKKYVPSFLKERHKILLTNKIILTSLRPLLSSFKTSPGRKPEIPSWSVSPLWLKPLENN